MIFYLCKLNLELSGGLKNRGCEIKFSYMKVSLVEPVETSKTTFRYNEQPLGKTFRGKLVAQKGSYVFYVSMVWELVQKTSTHFWPFFPPSPVSTFHPL